jgi:precorrin-2 dehydrogenase/sirohydrochlorin ferrochelatase
MNERKRDMPYYPIMVDIENQRVVVVGGGKVARRKIETLLAYGAVVHVISREVTPAVGRLLEEGRIKHMGRDYERGLLVGAFMVIAATSDSDLNHEVSVDAREMGLLVNAVDQPADCNFIVPSILSRGDLMVAVSTSGKSPALAKRIRQNLEEDFGLEYELLLRLMGRLRVEILSKGLSQKENSLVFHELVDSTLLEALRGEDWEEAARIINEITNSNFSGREIRVYAVKD